MMIACACGGILELAAIGVITWIVSIVSAWFFNRRQRCCNPKCKHNPDNPTSGDN